MSQMSIRYLGVHIDCKANSKAHTSIVVKKTDATTRALRGIMPNTRGPTFNTRKLLAVVPHSILLYGAPVWCRTMAPGAWKIMVQCQRRIALRVASAYRTISGNALLILAGTPPIDLMAAERAEMYEGRHNTGGVETRHGARKKEEKWQTRWASSKKGEWTRRLILDIAP